MDFDIQELTARSVFKTGKEVYALNKIGAGLLLGKPYFQELEVSYKGEKFVFPNEPLISLSLQKTIVETATVGKERRGTVKEYICTEDYVLSIKGICFNPDAPEEYPTEQVQELQRLFEINDSVEILGNPFLILFDIKNLVFKSIDWAEMAGQQGIQMYSISAVSDTDFYADLSEQAKFVNS